MKVFVSEAMYGAAAGRLAAASHSPKICGPRKLQAPPGLCEPAYGPPPGLELRSDWRCPPSVSTRSPDSSKYCSEVSASEDSAGGAAREWRTTVHVRNLPCYLTPAAFVELLDAQALSGHYDFVYVPMDFKTKQGIGYAFVNFTSSTAALAFQAAMHGFKSWAIHSRKVCSVLWSQTQGLDKNIKFVRKSDVMRKSRVPEEFKPMVFASGVRVPIPDAPQGARPCP